MEGFLRDLVVGLVQFLDRLGEGVLDVLGVDEEEHGERHLHYDDHQQEDRVLERDRVL